MKTWKPWIVGFAVVGGACLFVFVLFRVMAEWEGSSYSTRPPTMSSAPAGGVAAAGVAAPVAHAGHGAVEGVLTSATGDPIADRSIRLRRTGSRMSQLARTGADGSFRFEKVVSGEWRAELLSAEHDQASIRLANVEVVADEVAELRAVEPGTGVITGTVRIRGESGTGVRIVLIDSAGAEIAETIVALGSNSWFRSPPRYQFACLRDGVYTVRFVLALDVNHEPIALERKVRLFGGKATVPVLEGHYDDLLVAARSP